MFLVLVFNNCSARKRALWLQRKLKFKWGTNPIYLWGVSPKATATTNLSISGCNFKEGITSIARETCCKGVKLGSLGVSLVPWILPWRQRAIELWCESFLLPPQQTRLDSQQPAGQEEVLFILFIPVSQHPAQCFTCRWNLTDGTMIKRSWDLPRILRSWNLNSILLNPSLMTLTFSLFPWHKYMFTYHSPEIYENFFTFSLKKKKKKKGMLILWCILVPLCNPPYCKRVIMSYGWSRTISVHACYPRIIKTIYCHPHKGVTWKINYIGVDKLS